MVNKARSHWYDFGGVLALLLLIFAFVGLFFSPYVSYLRFFVILQFVSLLLHELEEYRYPGNLPIVLNKVMFHSSQPDRYPADEAVSFVINVLLAWLVYILAILTLSPIIIMITIVISLGNFIAHTFVFPIKGRLFYNPGMITGFFLFAPLSIYLIILLSKLNLLTPYNLGVGIVAGLVLNFSIFFVAMIMKNQNSPYPYSARKK